MMLLLHPIRVPRAFIQKTAKEAKPKCYRPNETKTKLDMKIEKLHQYYIYQRYGLLIKPMLEPFTTQHRRVQLASERGTRILRIFIDGISSRCSSTTAIVWTANSKKWCGDICLVVIIMVFNCMFSVMSYELRHTFNFGTFRFQKMSVIVSVVPVRQNPRRQADTG